MNITPHLYRAEWTRRGITRIGHASESLSTAIAEGQRNMPGAKVVIITRDSRGSDHPANAGKFFLHQILK